MTVQRVRLPIFDFHERAAETETWLRLQDNREHGRKSRNGAPEGPEGEWIHFIGALGEVLVAELLDLPWPPPLGADGSPDLPHGIEVKSSEGIKHQRTGEIYTPNLAIPHFNNPARRYVCVWIQLGIRRADVLGWKPGSIAMRDEYLFVPNGRHERRFFKFPWRDLDALSDLIAIVTQEQLDQQRAAELASLSGVAE